MMVSNNSEVNQIYIFRSYEAKVLEFYVRPTLEIETGDITHY